MSSKAYRKSKTISLGEWIDAAIWDKKYDSFIGKHKYDVTWEDDMKRRGWVGEAQLREISYFDQEK